MRERVLEKANIGLIGLGHFGELQTLILSQLPNVNLEEALDLMVENKLETISAPEEKV